MSSSSAMSSPSMVVRAGCRPQPGDALPTSDDHAHRGPRARAG
jgi:hypothetical protein